MATTFSPPATAHSNATRTLMNATRDATYAIQHASVRQQHELARQQHAMHRHQVHHDQHHAWEASTDSTMPPNPAYAVLLVYGILFLMVGAQAALFLWRKKHQRSYDLVTLVGLWLMPPMLCVQLKFWRFLLVWLAYSSITARLLTLCARQRMELSTPRKVYGWFLGVYKVSKFVGVAGYLVLLFEMLGGSVLMRMLFPAGFAIDLIWYGVYFGVLGRDCAEVATDRMASSLGTQGRKLVSTVNNCGICNNELKDFSHLGDQQDSNERVIQLSCRHCFHDQCIRGWTMVGKKDTCPCCCEKVDLRSLYADRPWETRNLTWIQMLDTVRYLVVWNPLIFMALSFAFHFMAPASITHDHHAPSQHQLDYAGNATHPALLLGSHGHANNTALPPPVGLLLPVAGPPLLNATA